MVKLPEAEINKRISNLNVSIPIFSRWNRVKQEGLEKINIEISDSPLCRLSKSWPVNFLLLVNPGQRGNGISAITAAKNQQKIYRWK
jgi:hypothetical protein